MADITLFTPAIVCRLFYKNNVVVWASNKIITVQRQLCGWRDIQIKDQALPNLCRPPTPVMSLHAPTPCITDESAFPGNFRNVAEALNTAVRNRQPILQ